MKVRAIYVSEDGKIHTGQDEMEITKKVKELNEELVKKNILLELQVAAMQYHELEKVLPDNVIQLWDADFLVKYAIGYFNESLPFLEIDEDTVRAFIKVKRKDGNDDKD